jgi:hypothetical protein
MEVIIRQAILHVLDTTVDRPDFSDAPMELAPDKTAYLQTCIERLMATDEARSCRLRENSAFASELAQNQDFTDLSRRIAGVMFDYMHAHPTIPCADLAVVDYDYEDENYLAVLKLNYKNGYTHRTDTLSDGMAIHTISAQRACLPAPTVKLEEGALIHRADGGMRLIEKKYDIDGTKDFYLSPVIFECTQEPTEKKKLEVIHKAAVQAVQDAYTEEPHAAEQVAVMLCNEAAEQDNVITAEAVKQRIQEDYPMAAAPFEAAVEEAQVAVAEPVRVSPAKIRRLESRCLRTASGIEIKIPAELIASDSAVEFIHDDDGSLSMLIKDVIV